MIKEVHDGIVVSKCGKLPNTDGPLGDDPIMFYDFLICPVRFGWCALESASSEFKHMDT